MDKDTKISNVNTLSALLDRLITERIKHYFFIKNHENESAKHQILIINAIKHKIKLLLCNIYTNNEYDFIDEKRTFADNMVESIDCLINCDIHIGESDRARLEFIITQEKRLRIANENRAKAKNDIDDAMQGLA